METTNSANTLTIEKLREAMEACSPPWEKWARHKGVVCRLHPNEIVEVGQVYVVQFDGVRTIVAHPDTLADARAMLKPMSDRDLATMLAWHAELKALRNASIDRGL